MKKQLHCFLLILLVLSFSLNLTQISVLTSAIQFDEKNITADINSMDRSHIIDECSLTFQETKNFIRDESNSETQKTAGRYSEAETDFFCFNFTNEWIKFAYKDSNETRLIVGVDGKDNTSLSELEKIAEKYEAEIVNTILIKGEIEAIVLQLPSTSLTAFVEEARRMNLASYIEPDMKVQVLFEPNDPYWNLQWGPRRIEANWAWNTTVGDSSVVVAVVDTGIDYGHPDLTNNYVPLGYDWVNNDNDPLDDFGHGTHCAGIIAAVLNNSLGVAGLAQVKIMAEKCFDSWGYGYWDWIANGIIHAVDAGADIISMSFGWYAESKLLHDAIKYAYDSGVLLIAAAGNDYTTMKLYPAGYDEVIAVAATDWYDNTAYFSNWGDWIELAAPGVDIYSTMPTYYVTMNDWGYSMNYDYMSGTSMACPHVAGVAALIWSLHPNKTRDWVRLWLCYTADDLGAPGFDIYYGCGRINARKAVEEPPPAHELIAYQWTTPPYVEPGDVGVVNVTVLNFGGNDESNVTVQLIANSTVVDTTLINTLTAGNVTIVSLLWNPTIEGLYNLTVYVVPVASETNFENNVLQKYIYAGFPVKAVVLHSAGNVVIDIITNWQVLNNQWYLFGDTMVYIDYTTLNKEGITYEDIASTEADVLIISCAFDPYSGWEFTDSEIDAIAKYVHEGHGLIVTAGTFYFMVPNNNKLASLLGMNETTTWSITSTDLLNLLNVTHPLIANVPNPFVFPVVGTAIPYDWRWDSNELVGGKYLALGHYQESAIVVYRGLVYIAPWLEVIPPYYHHHLQLLYNAITWSRYQKPRHDLVVSLPCPFHVDPGETIILNATVSNMGLRNETNVKLVLLINSEEKANLTVPMLRVGESETLSYNWTPAEGTYNVTAYAPPVPGEEEVLNNVETKHVRVSYAAVIGFIETHGESLHSEQLKLYYESLGHIVNTIRSSLTPELLAEYDIIIVGEDWSNAPWSISEITAVEDFIRSGGGFVAIGDELAFSVQEILSEYGIRYTGFWPYAGSSDNIDRSHPIMKGVNYIYVPSPINSLSSAPPSYWIANDPSNTYIMIAGAEVAGKVICMSDDFAAYVYDDDNEIMFANVIYWLKPPEHDLAVTLDAPAILEVAASTLLNVTVNNIGLNNETNVELQLIINRTVIASVLLPELSAGESYKLSYLWTPKVEGVYNVTAYVPPVSGECIINNAVSVNVRVRYVIPRVAVLNSWDIPPYFVGGWNNDYQILVDALNSEGYYAQAVTNEEIINGILNFFDVFVMVDNVPNEVSVPYVTDFWLSGGGILAFDSSICFLCYAGILPPESAGSSGYYVYWDYETDWQARVTAMHPVTAGYEVGQIIYGTAGDAEYWVDALADTSAYPYYSVLVEDLTMSDRAYVSAYEPPFVGKVVHIWDQSQWDNAELQLMILNSVDWLTTRYEHDLAVSLDTTMFIELSSSTLLNATVCNRGLNNETDVELYLLIDGERVANTTIPKLNVGESYTISYLWTPTKTGSHNITVYAPPVSGEENTINNVISRNVGVFVYQRLYISHKWVGGGSPMGWHADDGSWEYDLPFNFPFYEINYTKIYVSSNGLITLIAPDASFSNSITELTRKLAIAPAWDDWTTYEPNDIYIWENFTHVGIRWYVTHLSTGAEANFEAILKIDGTIQFNYGYNNGPVSATIGISNGVNHILAEEVGNLNYINTIIFTPIYRDVAVYNVTAYPNQVFAGQPVNINVTVANEGEIPEKFNVEVYYHEASNSTSSTSTSLMTSSSVELHSADAMWIAPSYINLTNYSVGQKFNITIWLNRSSTSTAWQIGLIYRKTYLNATRTGYTAGTTSEFFQGKSTIPVSPKFGSLNATHNQVLFGEAILIPPYKEPGYGSLCWIEFEILEKPAEPFMDYLTLDPSESYVLNEYNEYVWPKLFSASYGFGIAPPTPPTPANLIGQATVELPPSVNVTLNFVWNTSGVPLGNYTIEAVMSPVQGEIDIEDNTFQDGIVQVLWQHDVAVFSVEVSSTWVYQGWPVYINITAINKGDFVENITLLIYNNFTADSIIGNITLENVQPGENVTVAFTWDTTRVPYCINYTVTVKAEIGKSDGNPNDNILRNGSVKVRILGDVNGDDKVDVEDISMVARAFGARPDRPRWDPILDLDQNMKIDIADVYIVAKHFGTYVNF